MLLSDILLFAGVRQKVEELHGFGWVACLDIWVFTRLLIAILIPDWTHRNATFCSLQVSG